MKRSLSSKEIRLVLKKSNLFKSSLFSIRFNKGRGFKVGFSVGRHFGSSVLRNRFKRQIRGFFNNDIVWKNKNVFLVVSPNVSANKMVGLFSELKKFHSFLLNQQRYTCFSDE